MTLNHHAQRAIPVLFLVVCLAGCPKAPDYPSVSEDPASEQSDDSTAENTEQPAAPARVLEPVKVPETLAGLDELVEWEDQPVLDILEQIRQQQAESPPPLSVADALVLKNDSKEANDKIVGTLGRLYENEADVDWESEINRHLPADVSSTNPIMQSSLYEGYIVGLIGMGFFSFDAKFNPFAPTEYVKSWQTSKDKLYDKVVIRDDLFWSDGTPITAHDVVFSYQTIMNPKIAIPAVRTGMDALQTVKAYDDHTFVIVHRESLSMNVWNCNFPVIPKHIYEKTIDSDPTLVTSEVHQKYERDPVCGGPYRILTRTPGQEIVLERREEWYMHNGQQVRPKPKFKRIRFRVITDTTTSQLALTEGKIEDMQLEPRQWIEQTNDDRFYRLNTKVRGEEWTFYYIGYNLGRPLFRDARVRRALSYSVDYDYILKTLCYGLYEQSAGEFHPDSWAGPVKPRTPYKQDLALADKLLNEAGWVDTDGDGIRDKTIGGRKVNFDFEIICANDKLRIDICTSFKDSLNRLGIECHVRPTEFTVMQQKAQDHEYDAMFGGWGVGTDPWTSENLWKTGEQRNFGQFSNKEVDELFDKAKIELVRDKRAEYYRRIDDILWEEQPYTWLYYRSGFYAFNKRLRGYGLSPRGVYSFSPGFDSFWPAAQ